MLNIRYIAVAVAIAAATAGCAREPCRTCAVAPLGKRTAKAIALERYIDRMRDATRSVKALVWLKLANGDEERRTEAALVVARPSSVRVDAMDALADVWATGGSDGENLWFYLPGKDKLYSGRATKGNLNRLARFEWTVPELVSLLAGTPPMDEAASLFQTGGRRDRHFKVWGQNLHLWTDRGGELVERCVRYGRDGASIDYIVEFASYRHATGGGLKFPHFIRATFPSRRAMMVVEYRDVSLGDEIDDSVFAAPERKYRRRVMFEK